MALEQDSALTLSRDQIAAFAKDPQTIKQFELLTTTLNNLTSVVETGVTGGETSISSEVLAALAELQSSVGTAPPYPELLAASVGGGAALTRVNDTNVTITLGGTPATALLAATSLTMGWTGTLAPARGGTGVSALGDLTRTNDTNVTLTLGGTPTGALVNSTSLTLGWTGTLAVTRGGSGAGTLTGLLVGNGTSAFTTIAPGTGVTTALAVNVGSAGAFVTFNGALGTPSSGALSNCTFPTLNQNTTGSAATLTTGRTIGMTGDVTWASASFNGSANVTGTATIANDAVTYAKIQNVSATDKLLGRSTAGSGDVEEIACTAAGRALIDDADASAQRTTLGLGTMATQNASAVSIGGGTAVLATLEIAGAGGAIVIDDRDGSGLFIIYHNAGVVSFYDGVDRFTISGVLIAANVPLRLPSYTVATLPAAATVGAGATAFVTDALAPAFGAAVAGGGAVGVPVYSTGAAWNVG